MSRKVEMDAERIGIPRVKMLALLEAGSGLLELVSTFPKLRTLPTAAGVLEEYDRALSALLEELPEGSR